MVARDLGERDTGSYWLVGLQIQLYDKIECSRSAVQHPVDIPQDCTVQLKSIKSIDLMLCSYHKNKTLQPPKGIQVNFLEVMDMSIVTVVVVLQVSVNIC